MLGKLKKVPWRKVGKVAAKVATTAALGGSAPIVAPQIVRQAAEAAQAAGAIEQQPSDLMPIVAILAPSAVSVIALLVKRPQDD